MSAAPSVALVVSHIALLRLGAVVVPANTAYLAREIDYIRSTTRPVLAIMDRRDRVAGLPCDDADPALIGFTSGTTGRPKGAVLSQCNLAAGAPSLAAAWGWSNADRLIYALPLFHMQGLGVAVHGTFTAGIAIRILPEFVPTEVATAIDVERATLFFGVPTMFARLAESDQLTSLASLRLIVSGSAPLPVELFGRIESDCGQAPIERYGMTETVMLCSNPLMGSRQAGRVGAPLPGVEVRRASDAGVEVRGPSVFAGFFEDPDASAAAFIPDGWFKTGDLAEFDATGSLRLIGRSTDLIITGGYNVYPREVEDVLRSHPAVRDVAVVGRPDQKWGETVVAFVVSDSVLGLPAELSAHVESLAPFKRPREWQLISEIPRNAIGKMQREMLARRPVDADYHVTTRGPRAGS